MRFQTRWMVRNGSLDSIVSLVVSCDILCNRNPHSDCCFFQIVFFFSIAPTSIEKIKLIHPYAHNLLPSQRLSSGETAISHVYILWRGFRACGLYQRGGAHFYVYTNIPKGRVKAHISVSSMYYMCERMFRSNVWARDWHFRSPRVRVGFTTTSFA